MTSPRQTVERTVDDKGNIHVSTTSYITEDITALTLDADGVRHVGFRTEEEIRAVYNVPNEYELVVFKPNNWVQQDSGGYFIAHQAKATFAPPSPGKFVMDNLLAEIRDNSPLVPKYNTNRKKEPKVTDKMLEISIMDPHVGLDCYRGASDMDYNLEIAHNLYMWALTELVQTGMRPGVTEILFPIGNDFLHAEPSALQKGVGYATSGGTVQPEMVDYYRAYVEGECMLREAITYLSEQGVQVYVPVVFGNHDKVTTWTLGRVMNAFFHNNENVTIDCEPTARKYKQFGCNLIGFEHGHDVAQVRLAALMANEQPEAWLATKGGYREWHLGDQHRKGSAKPSMLEEQGVSVEYLPSLVAPNTWHNMKSFNYQKRGAMSWLWDAETGLATRMQVNINSYTGLPMGS